MPEPSASEPDDVDWLEGRLGHRFNDRSMLMQALTHRSYCAENVGVESNERLEFLGDAVLGLVITARIYQEFPELPEGDLAKLRAGVVNAGVLAEAAAGLGLGRFLLLGKGEDASGGREKPSILADSLEAVLGATYLDGGWDAAGPLVSRVFDGLIAEAALGPGGHDYKTRLQELASKVLDKLPRYDITDEGPDHAKRFTARVVLQGDVRGTGEGSSKKQAEQAAALLGWEWLSSHIDESQADSANVSPSERRGHA